MSAATFNDYNGNSHINSHLNFVRKHNNLIIEAYLFNSRLVSNFQIFSFIIDVKISDAPEDTYYYIISLNHLQ